MMILMADAASEKPSEKLDAVVHEVAASGQLAIDKLPPDERAYLQEHALKKPLRVLDIWALGVGAVVSGVYFGWNLGLKDNGPIAMLIASLLVCLLYLTWVLALAELSVAMPFAGGPLAYGRRAADSSLGFVMAWSMLLECQFAMIAIVLAAGGYIAFLIEPSNPSAAVEVCAALATVVVFFFIHAWGVKEQSRVMMVMTYGAILGLVIFWIAAGSNFSWSRVWTAPVLPPEKGWKAVLEAVPYALWWLVVIEAVALAAEEAREPHRTIPRGLVWAQLTLIGLVVLTWLFACGAVESQRLAITQDKKPISYPLAEALRLIPAGKSPLLISGFGVIAIFGLLASYHGIAYGTSRQVFALGRAGYLPQLLGEVHATRRTPVPALAISSLVTAGFVVAHLWLGSAIEVAVLVSTLTALIWYVLAMGCLILLRRREPHLFHAYQAPLRRTLPATVIALSIFSIYMYSVINIQVVPFTALLYALGLGYYWFRGHSRIQHAAPEELAARTAHAAAQEKTR
jgi:ethanolamine permease